jgi:hypothetical protein
MIQKRQCTITALHVDQLPLDAELIASFPRIHGVSLEILRRHAGHLKLLNRWWSSCLPLMDSSAGALFGSDGGSGSAAACEMRSEHVLPTDWSPPAPIVVKSHPSSSSLSSSSSSSSSTQFSSASHPSSSSSSCIATDTEMTSEIESEVLPALTSLLANERLPYPWSLGALLMRARGLLFAELKWPLVHEWLAQSADTSPHAAPTRVQIDRLAANAVVESTFESFGFDLKVECSPTPNNRLILQTLKSANIILTIYS